MLRAELRRGKLVWQASLEPANGAVFIETAIVVPVLLLLTLLTVWASYLLLTYHAMSVIARDAALAASPSFNGFNGCVDADDAVMSQLNPTGCQMLDCASDQPGAPCGAPPLDPVLCGHYTAHYKTRRLLAVAAQEPGWGAGLPNVNNFVVTTSVVPNSVFTVEITARLLSDLVPGIGGLPITARARAWGPPRC